MNSSIEHPELEAALKAEADLEVGKEKGEEQKNPEQPEAGPEATTPEQVVEALEADPKFVEAAKETLAEAKDAPMNKGEQKEEGIETKGVEAMAAALEAAPDNEGLQAEAREMLDKLLQDRYNLTLSEVLGAFKMGWKGYAMDMAMGGGTLLPDAAGDATSWALSKALEVEPKDMGLAETAEVKLKLGADMLRVVEILILFIPGVDVADIPLELIGQGMRGVGSALEAYNNKDASSYDATKAATMAVLPKNPDGSVDMEKVHGYIAKAGELALDQHSGEDGAVKTILGKIKENPELLTSLLAKFDALKKIAA